MQKNLERAEKGINFALAKRERGARRSVLQTVNSEENIDIIAIRYSTGKEKERKGKTSGQYLKQVQTINTADMSVRSGPCHMAVGNGYIGQTQSKKE